MARLHYRDPDTGAWIPLSTGSSGGTGGVSDHGLLTGLTDPDHPIGAVVGLQAALDAKSDTTHTHAIPIASSSVPQGLSTGTGVVGTSADYARGDHRHQVFVANPVALGSAISQGVSTSMARADHVHPYPTAANVGADSAGTASTAVTNHTGAADPHPVYLRPVEVLAGTNVTIDTASTPGSVIISAAGGGGGDSGITDHGQLTGLTDPDHPISAVQGLQAALDATATKSYVDARHEVVVQLTQPAAAAPVDLWVDPDAVPEAAPYVLSSGDEMTGALASPAFLMIGDIPPLARAMFDSDNPLPLLEESPYEGNLAATRDWVRALMETGSGAPEVHIGDELPTDSSVLWMDTDESPISAMNASDLMTHVEELQNRLMRMEALLAAHGITEQ